MIQFLADSIDQLDLALDQLAVTDRNFDRFAMMLIDNVVELTLHRYAQDRASEDEFWRQISKPKYDAKSIEAALGPFFGKKVKLAASLGLVAAPAANSIFILHSYRNTAYHQGLRHEGMLHSLALFYFRNACALLNAYEPRFWSWSSLDVISHRARKYLGDPNLGIPQEVFSAAYARLEEVASSMKQDLIGDLSRDAEATIETTDNAIQFLADESPRPMTRKHAVISAQAWAFAFSDEAREFARVHGCKEKNVGSYVEWLMDNHKWPTNSDPIPQWRKRVKALQTESDPHVALRRHRDFISQTEAVRQVIDEAARQLDTHVQNEIDRIRGK